MGCVKLIVLDTHIWIKYINGDEKLKKLSGIIDKASETSGIRVSSISIWEIAMLEKLKKINLSKSIDEWISLALSLPGLRIEYINPKIAIDSTRLPDFEHKDPADRIIISTARYLDAKLITLDKKILDYSKNGYVKTLDF